MHNFRFQQPFRINWYHKLILFFIRKKTVTDELTGSVTTYKKFRGKYYLINFVWGHYPAPILPSPWIDIAKQMENNYWKTRGILVKNPNENGIINIIND